MAVLNLRDIDEELVVELRVHSARAGVSLKEFCVRALREAVGSVATRELVVKPVEPKVSRVVKELVDEPKKKVADGAADLSPAGNKKCPDCDSWMTDWSSLFWRCKRCGRNHPK
jgi:plasmid stability protein